MLSGPNSGVIVLPRNTNPAALQRATTSSSCSGTRSCHSAVPCVLHDARGVVEVLDRDRHAEERRERRRRRRARRASAARACSTREVGRDGDVRVQLRVQRLDAREIALDQLGRRHLAAPDHRGLLDRRRERELTLVHRPLLLGCRSGHGSLRTSVVPRPGEVGRLEVADLSRSSSAVPASTTRPCRSTTTRSAMLSASPACCSTRSTPTPASAAARTATSSRCTTSGASPSDSSSTSSSRGVAGERAPEREHLLLAAREQPGAPLEQRLELGEQLDRAARRPGRAAGCRDVDER